MKFAKLVAAFAILASVLSVNSFAKVALTGLPAADPPGTMREVTIAGALVAAADELVLVSRVWADGRYTKPLELMSH